MSMIKPDKSSLFKVIVIYRRVSRILRSLAANEINNNANYVKLRPPDGSIIALAALPHRALTSEEKEREDRQR